jgi:arylformamidase
MISDIYRGMDRLALDAAYNNLASVPDSAKIIQSWADRSVEFHNRCCAIDLTYGSSPRQKIDYFFTEKSNAPLFVFIHGGYWQRNNKTMFSFVAGGLTDDLPDLDGVNVAVIGYTLAPDAKLREINNEINRAIDYLFRNHAHLGFDADKILVGGWSAGGHLAAMTASNPLVKGVICLSGIFDLEPISLCYVNELLQLDYNEVTRLSPLRNPCIHDIPFFLFVGDNELPELQRQSEDYARVLQDLGHQLQFEKIKTLNHFTIMDELALPGGRIARSIRNMASD